ncbi:hypothetical protein V6B14_12160 [Sporosarcina psychrophila]
MQVQDIPLFLRTRNESVIKLLLYLHIQFSTIKRIGIDQSMINRKGG